MSSNRVQIGTGTITFLNNDTTQTILQSTATQLEINKILNAGSNVIKVGVDPVDNEDLTNKSYVDTQIANNIQGLDVKDSVRFTTIANIPDITNTILNNDSALVDLGVSKTLVDGDRILVKSQAIGKKNENGIYNWVETESGVSGVGNLQRSLDFNSASDVSKGAFSFVFDGVNEIGKAYAVTEYNGNFGTDPISFSVISNSVSGSTNASNLTSGTLDATLIQLNGSSLTDDNGLKISASGVTNDMLFGNIAAGKLAGGIGDSKLNTITANEKVSGSAVQLNDTGGLSNESGLKISSGGVTNDMLDGNIAAEKLLGSIGDSKLNTITATEKVAGSAVQLNGTGGLSNDSGLKISSGGVTNDMLAGSIENSKLTNSSLTIIAGTGLSAAGSVSLGGSINLSLHQDISTTSDVTFNSVTSGTITATSDPKLKENMTIIPKCLDKVDQINAYSFNWKNEEHAKDGLQYGLNAEEVQVLNSDLIKTDISGFKSVNYNGVMAVLLGAIKELKNEINELKNK